ncbi:MAG TPA: RNA polymerase sigma factor [Gammaproteobacteria bacterium]|jgi:RNA polymerase sigma factor (sigma-70 family)|nr:RNA polymerase sigma factor [Gammaproteobacteria bacterium]
MKQKPPSGWMTAEQERQISDEIVRERPRLRGFIRRWVRDDEDVEDILQEVFFELVETYRLAKQVEQVSAWLFRVARNRITDRFRKKKTEALDDARVEDADEDESLDLEGLLPSPEAGPEAAYMRGLMLEEIDAALAELPPEQQDVFIAHELEGKSFKELAAETGLSVNTLLSRKRYAVLHLRQRLQTIYDELNEI